jgi:hypothetical protein
MHAQGILAILAPCNFFVLPRTIVQRRCRQRNARVASFAHISTAKQRLCLAPYRYGIYSVSAVAPGWKMCINFDLDHCGAILKILSIRQPWAYLITQGVKNVEDRSWPTNYRGPFLIQASLNINRLACRQHKLNPNELKTGGIVGMAEIVDCVSDHRSPWFEGPYGFVLRNRRSLPFVKWKGALGLREARTRLLRRLGL